MTKDNIDETNQPDKTIERDEIEQILDDFYDGVFIDELPKAKAKIQALISNAERRARDKTLADITIWANEEMRKDFIKSLNNKGTE